MSEHTPGPWAWFGNAGSNHIYLATTHSGRRYIMDFTRWGMQGAQPRFQPVGEGMVNADKLVTFAVGDKTIRGVAAARKDGSVYRYDISGIDHPDARLIAAAPDLLEALRNLAEQHARLVGSGDCGFWDVEKEDEMIAARAAISKAEGV